MLTTIVIDDASQHYDVLLEPKAVFQFYNNGFEIDGTDDSEPYKLFVRFKKKADAERFKEMYFNKLTTKPKILAGKTRTSTVYRNRDRKKIVVGGVVKKIIEDTRNPWTLKAVQPYKKYMFMEAILL